MAISDFLTYEKSDYPEAYNSEWSGKVYTSYSITPGANLTLTCSFACSLDPACTFHLLYESVCYLGNLEGPNDNVVLAPGEGTHEITLHYSKTTSLEQSRGFSNVLINRILFFSKIWLSLAA